jgi:N-acetylglucosamine kinase-like BadF-type ATPase
VDGGQSSTTTLIGDETGRVLGAGTVGPAGRTGAEEGRAKFLRAIRESLAADTGFALESSSGAGTQYL